MTDFAYTDEQWGKIKDVLLDQLGRDADEIELARPAGELMRMVGVLTTTMSLRGCIETAASLHIADSALHSQTPGYKDRVKQLEAMRDKADALHKELVDAMSPSVTLDGDNVRHVILGGDLRAKYGLNVDPFDEAGRAFATVTSVIDAGIASMAEQSPQQTANSRKAGRDHFWNEMLAIWTGIGGDKETGTAAAEWLVATSNAVFDRVREIGGDKTTYSAPYGDDEPLAAVVEWLRLRAKARQATS